MTRERRVAAAAALVLALALTTACAPDPAPTPTPTGFASEEEAFAAAEATYRAYVDALNAVDLSDPATFEPVYDLTAGDARDSISKELSRMHAESWVVSGKTSIGLIEARDTGDFSNLLLNVCADVSDVTLTDASGVSQVASDRPAIQPLTVRVDVSTAPHVVTSISWRTGEPQC